MSITSPGYGADAEPAASERQITRGPGGRILTNTGVWSPDSRWIVYDTRSDAGGDVFDGERIEAVNVETGEVRRWYESRNGARCGVVTFHPQRERVVFIHGPEAPTPEWSYGAPRRQGTWVDGERPGVGRALDARDMVPPFTAGALRGGSHVHVFSPDGGLVSFTYEDQVLAQLPPGADADPNQRNVGVCVVDRPVRVGRGHPRNQDGTAFSVLVTRTTARPRPGSDEILKACEEGWVGTNGYVHADGGRRRALAFQGHVVTATGTTNVEVFVVDLPADLTVAGDGPLQGTASRRPAPPRGTEQRRLTFTADRPHGGLQGAPRHWLRVSPDGNHIAFLMKDDAGVVQLWTVAPQGGAPRPVSRVRGGVASAFSWSPDGARLAHVAEGRVCVTEFGTGETRRLTPIWPEGQGPRPEACVFSPDGGRIAYVRRLPGADGKPANQIFTVAVPR